MAFAYGHFSLFLHNPGPVHMAAADALLEINSSYIFFSNYYLTLSKLL